MNRFLIAGVVASLSFGVPLASQTASAPEKTASKVSDRDRDKAETAYLAGARNLKQKLLPQAEVDFARAASLNPNRPEYLQALLLSREHRVTDLLHLAAEARPSNPAKADGLVEQARAIDRDNPSVTQHDAAAPIVQTRTQLADGLALLPNRSRHSYHERTDLRALAEKMASDFGLRVAFDSELSSKQVRIDVDDASYEEASSILMLLSDTMIAPLEPRRFILANDTTPNRQRLEHLVQVTFLLPGIAADQLKDFVSIAQTLLNVKQVSVSANQHELLVRGPADRVDVAEKIFRDLLQGTSDVVIDLKLYSVERQHVRNLGVVLPQSISGSSLSTEAQSIVNANQSLINQLVASGVIPSNTSVYDLAAYLVFVAGIGKSSLLANTFLIFGGGISRGLLSAGSIPVINLALVESEARTLEDVQVRASDRGTAIFKTGVRYPIQTSLFSDIASSITGANTSVNGVSLSSLLSQYLGTSSVGSSAVVPQVQYEDIGLTVTATPRVQRTGDVSMHLEVKMNALAGTSLNGIPVLASRQLASDLTVHDGETAMLITSTSRAETAAVTGLPGLNDLPGFQSGTNHNGSEITNNLVLLITPHITRMGHTQAKGPYIPLASRPDDD